MKQTKCLFIIIISFLISFYSCNKDEININEDSALITNESSVEKQVYVKSGVLCFSDKEAILNIEQELNGLNDDQLADWENKMGFQHLVLITKDNKGKIHKENVLPVRFVPMTGKVKEH